ncbi:MAG: DASS family sodium-coupled anion symporter, partial [Veillonella dispar]|nr:DASS family sodium-coupled anion symporter [Veillonella dispar]
ATPSNTARAAGIVYPINLSIAEAVGSYPGETAKKAGAYLLQNGYFATKVTSFLFATAMAPNYLALDFITKLTGVSLNWAQWAAAMFVPGFIMLMLIPLIGYMYERPSVKDIDNKKIAADGLAELGPMKASEKGLIVIALLAITGWILPTFDIKIDATAVAIVAMIATFVCGIISWDDLLKTKAAWNTLIWFGGILGLSSALTKGKFFEWLAKYLEAHMNFGLDPFMMLILISIISVVVRYFFASGTAYISAMLPVFLIVGINAGIDPTLLAFIMIGTNAYGGSVTHYGAAPGPIIFSAGYNNVKDWWTVGLISAVVCLVLNYVIGIPWWKITGFM